jgi:SAM-dependent methyltransferase
VYGGLDRKDIENRALALRKQYKLVLQRGPDASAARVSLLHRKGVYRKGAILIDLGGGISGHNGLLAQLGMAVYVVDMLGDYWENKATAPSAISEEVKLLEACGVQFISHEISTYDLTVDFAENSVDVVTSFHCIEHLHRSPRLVLESAMRVLKPGGKMFIEVPNAANARKRLALLRGHTNYEPYNKLYYTDPFVGHVREYTVGDLRQLAQNLGASRYRVFGKNTIYGWEWLENIPSPIRNWFDHALQAFPGLCSALLLELTKT